MLPIGLSKQRPCIKMTILSLLAVGLLSGCGIRGTLKTPPPIFGGDTKVDPDRVPNENTIDNQDDGDDLDVRDVDQVSNN